MTAEDGHVYERSAIEEWIVHATLVGNPLKSPLTNLAMGVKTFPSPQTKNQIENLIESGTVTGPLADKWMGRKTCEASIRFAGATI